MDWKKKFEDVLISDQDANQLVCILNEIKTTHANTAKSADKVSAIKIIYKTISDQEKLYELGMKFTNIEDPTANEIGVTLLSQVFSINPPEVIKQLYFQCDHTNWEVREWAASACGTVLSKYFNQFYSVLKHWVYDNSANIRRAVALASMYAANKLPETYEEQLIDLVEPLISDRDVYVRKNLGPFAIGAGLLKRYPDAVKKRITKWLQSDGEQTLWNVAMIFSSAEGAKHREFAIHVLSILCNDERKYVKGAVKSAIRNLNKRHNGLESISWT